jgi:formamidopyrimidine-DNA glycosylase
MVENYSVITSSCLALSSAWLLQPVSSFDLRMVEGHSVHRVAALHRQRLLGKKFTAWSPNGRFKEGAALINDQPFYRIEAVGKNLFAFFGDEQMEEKSTVVHVHFGMAGNWAVYEDPSSAAEPTATNRLRLEHPKIVADLSAMTVQHGDMNLYRDKRRKLGEDPLRSDADPTKLWKRVQTSNKSIGALIMDQSYFTGPGNIYRCEILFKAGIHPERIGKDLKEHEFQRIWYHTVDLLKRGYQTGSILTVDPEEAKQLGNPRLRRYIYNTSKCPRCGASIQSWPINNRTCYACLRCQPMEGSNGTSKDTATKDCVPYNSLCARETSEKRLRESGPERLTIKELKTELIKAGIIFHSRACKAELVKLVHETQHHKPALVSPEAAAAEKAAAGESLAVEHVAELAPGQALKARACVLKFTDEAMEPDPITSSSEAPTTRKCRTKPTTASFPNRAPHKRKM